MTCSLEISRLHLYFDITVHADVCVNVRVEILFWQDFSQVKIILFGFRSYTLM